MRQPAVLLALGLASQGVEAFSRKRAEEESWTPAQPTNVIDPLVEQALGLGTSPRPTQAPRDLFGRMELQPRLDGYTLGPGTCGYVSSNGNSFTCINTAATCDYDDEYLGCCLPNQDCTQIKTTCIDYSASADGECDLPDDWHTLCCNDRNYGTCYTWLFSTTTEEDDDLSTFTFLDCSARGGTGTLFDYDPAWSRTHSFESTTSTETSETATATDDDNGGNNDDGEDGGNGGDNNGGGGGGGSKTNVGAIAGGTVGGVAALGLVGAAAFLLLRRRKAKTVASDSQSSPSAPMTNPSGPNSPPPMTQSPSSPGGSYYPSGVPPGYQGYPPQSQSPQGYDPHMSMYSQQGYPQQHPQHGYQQPYQPGQPQPYPHQAFGGYQASSTGSPPPHTTPSPVGQNAVSGHVPVGQNPSSPAQELGTVNPVGMETNRAELG